MIRRRGRAVSDRDRQRARIVLAVCLLAAVLDHLDGRRAGLPIAPFVGAGIFEAIWTGLTLIAHYIGVAAEVTVTWLASVVSWLASRVASFLLSTGAVFSRVWEGIKIVWTDVLKPALVWIDNAIKNVHAWLVKTFKPVFQWLRDVRERLMGLYTKFVRPVLDTIDFIRAINKALLAFHVHVLEGLDRVLADIERRIEEPIRFLFQLLTRVQNVLDRIVSADGFFQRYTMVASLRKHSPAWMAYFWHDQIGPDVGKKDPNAPDTYPLRAAGEDAEELGAFLEGGGGKKTAVIEELSITLLAVANGETVPELAGPDL